MAELSTTSTASSNPTPPGALTTGVPAAQPAPSYAPPAQPRPDAISDARYRQLDAGERAKYTNVRGANGAGGEWVETSKVPTEPTDTAKPAAANGAPTVAADGRLQVGEFLLSAQDIQNLMA
jgi:hypothetical protein